MNSWNGQNQNNMMMGQAPYPNAWMPRLPAYHAEPIHGEMAAWQFPIGPNSEIYLPDADEDIIWWIRTDVNGVRNVQAFDVKPHEQPQPVDTADLAARLAAVEEWINGKQNKSNAKRSATTATTESSN